MCGSERRVLSKKVAVSTWAMAWVARSRSRRCGSLILAPGTPFPPSAAQTSTWITDSSSGAMTTCSVVQEPAEAAWRTRSSVEGCEKLAAAVSSGPDAATATDPRPLVLALTSPTMPTAVRALRGATTVDVDSPERITERVQELLAAMLERNGVDKADLISILFTATDDVVSMFPAAAARAMGLGDVPLMCARELGVTGGTPRCIRVMMHLTTDRQRAELRHIYLEGARNLRDDLPG